MREDRHASKMSKKTEDSEIVMIQSSDIKSNSGGQPIFRRKATMKDNRTAMERFIDRFWLVNIERIEESEERELSILEIDGIVHDLIHQLFLKAEDNQSLIHQVHLKKNLVHHQELILAIKDQIKPGLFKSHTTKFTPDMLKEYFISLQQKTLAQKQNDIKAQL